MSLFAFPFCLLLLGTHLTSFIMKINGFIFCHPEPLLPAMFLSRALNLFSFVRHWLITSTSSGKDAGKRRGTMFDV